MIYMYILLYLLVGFGICSYAVRRKSVNSAIEFVWLMVVYPLLCITIPYYFVKESLAKYIFWLNHADDIEKCFLFWKKVFIVYGDVELSSLSSGRYIFDSENTKHLSDEYYNLVVRGREKEVGFIKDGRFTKKFLRKVEKS